MTSEKDTSTFETWSLADIDRMEDAKNNPTMRASDPAHPDMFTVDPHGNGLTLWWGGYDYTVSLDATSTPEGLLWLLHHVLGKDWELTTQDRVVRLIGRISAHWGWKMYSMNAKEIEARTTSDAVERAKLTPKLRYDVLLRDNFRCRACGASAETGAHLHIDHISPISDGGRTEFDNLQALCSPCNYGKGARK